MRSLSVVMSPHCDAERLLDCNYNRAAVQSDDVTEDTNYREVRRRAAGSTFLYYSHESVCVCVCVCV